MLSAITLGDPSPMPSRRRWHDVVNAVRAVPSAAGAGPVWALHGQGLGVSAAHYLLRCGASSTARALHCAMEGGWLCSHGCPVLGFHPEYLVNAASNTASYFYTSQPLIASVGSGYSVVNGQLLYWPESEHWLYARTVGRRPQLLCRLRTQLTWRVVTVQSETVQHPLGRSQQPAARRQGAARAQCTRPSCPSARWVGGSACGTALPRNEQQQRP